MNFLVVFLGGGFGSLIRYLIGLGFQKIITPLPVATLVANITACMIYAASLNFIENIPALQADRGASALNLRLLILTGICGGLSTFSTFGYETFLLLKEQNYFWAISNILLSLALCIGVFILIKK